MYLCSKSYMRYFENKKCPYLLIIIYTFLFNTYGIMHWLAYFVVCMFLNKLKDVFSR